MAYKIQSKSILNSSVRKINKDFGTKLLNRFHEENRRNSNYKITFEQLISTLEKRPGAKNFLEILGGSVLDSGTNQGKALNAMTLLAINSKGKIPTSNASFKSAIVDENTSVSFTDAIIFTATESVAQVSQGIQEVGKTLIDTGKILNVLFPIAVIYFLYKFLNKKF